MKGIFKQLFDEIKHGDQEHIDWLHDKILEVQQRTLNIDLREWHYQCGDKCCDWYGTELLVNGEKVGNEYAGQDTENTLRNLLDYLGFNFTIENSYDFED